MKANFKLYYFFCLFSIVYCLLAFFISCRKESKNPFWNVDVLAPLVKSTLTINNIIPDSLLQHNPDNSLNIVYTTPFASFSLDSTFKIPDTTLSNSYVSPIQATIPPGGIIIPDIANNVTYGLGDVQLTKVILRKGRMLLNIKSQIQTLIDFTYKIPCMANTSGDTFNITVTIPAADNAGNDGIYSGTFDLSGFNLNLTGPAGTGDNILMTSFSAIVTPSPPGDTAHILSGQGIQISNTFTNILPHYAKGYFGNLMTPLGPDSTDFALFNHIIDGTLSIENIDIDFSIENSIGADARVMINNFSSINTKTGNTVSLSHSIIGSPLNINRAVDNNGNVASSTYSVSFNPSNSNIRQFIENFPDKMGYQMELEINPLGNVSGKNDFFYYDRLLKTEMNMTIPLSVIANNFTMADTLDFNMNAGADNVNYGKLYLYIDNGFPFTAQAQLYLMNDDFEIIDSLVSAPNVIFAPQLDANLVCAGKQLTKLTIPVDENKMNALRSVKKMYIKMKFNTAGQPNYVKIYSFYEMNVKLVGDFNYTVGKKD